MKRKFLYSVITAAVLSVSIPAFASSSSYKDQFKDAAPCCNWTGFYAGVSVGNAWDRVKNSLTVVNDATTPYFFAPAIPGVNASGSTNLNSSAIFEAIQGGYNYQMGDTVFGIEAAFNNLSNSQQSGGQFLYTTNGSPYGLRNSTSVNWLFSLRPRLGWTWGDALLYVNTGLSVARFKYNQFFTEGVFTPVPENTSYTNVRSGWNIGAGAEYMITCHWTVKGEYSFNRFGGNSTSGTLTAPGGSATFNNTQSQRDIHLLSLGVNYIFS